MSHDHHSMDLHIRRPLQFLGALLVFALVAVAFVSISGIGRVASLPQGEIVQVRALFFADQPDGTVLVTDADTATIVATLQVGEFGFVRSTLRGLARERRLHGLDNSEPFSIEARDNGQVLLKDCATGRYIDLVAFGPTNKNAFAQFLPQTAPRVAATDKETHL